MNDPEFLSVEVVESFHEKSIHAFGGTLGLRDRAALESAVFSPQNAYFFGRGDLFDVAAAYAFHIAQAQCFLDGNKRTAMASALAFLRRNGIQAKYDQQKLYELMIGFAEKRVTKADFAAYLRDAAARSAI